MIVSERADYVKTSSGTQIRIYHPELNFCKHVDMQNKHTSQQKIIKELQQLAFVKFRSGLLTLETPEKHQKAWDIIQRCDVDLIESLYSKDPFVEYIIKKELKARNLFCQDIYSMGFYGIDIAKKYAIAMLKDKIASTNEKLTISKTKENVSVYRSKKLWEWLLFLIIVILELLGLVWYFYV